jgi:nucleoside 2-deoxyribosyltransferase
MKIYLAGPDVFLPDAVEFGRRKAEICARHGLTGLYPLDNAIDLSARDASLKIFAGNEAMMIEADAIIANLTPEPSTNSASWRDAANSVSATATIPRATPIACANSPQ